MTRKSVLVTRECTAEGLSGIGCLLAAGHIVILRQVPAIAAIRESLLQRAAGHSPASLPALHAFYAQGKTPPLDAVEALSHAIHEVRRTHGVSRELAPLIERMGFGRPTRIDGGIPRLVLPAALVDAARESGRFQATDFKRERADGMTEIFMPGPANIHRDYNRRHRLLQCNLWFPLHDLAEDETIRIWPERYREDVTDMPLTDENLASLGSPASFRLAFGDAVLFHGEHLHTSPPHLADGYRRHTYDVRIAAFCPDDTAHYRLGFSDLRNFAQEDLASTGECGFDVMLAAGEPLTRVDAESLYQRHRACRFSEDRQLQLAERFAPLAPDLATTLLVDLIQTTGHWFWAQRALEALARIDIPAARVAADRVSDLQRNTPEPLDFTPIAFRRASNEPQPDTHRVAAIRAGTEG